MLNQKFQATARQVILEEATPEAANLDDLFDEGIALLLNATGRVIVSGARKRTKTPTTFLSR
jgi:hypothetical protein